MQISDAQRRENASNAVSRANRCPFLLLLQVSICMRGNPVINTNESSSFFVQVSAVDPLTTTTFYILHHESTIPMKEPSSQPQSDAVTYWAIEF